MTLGQQQRHFTKMVSLLLHFAEFMGYEVSLGDLFRDPRVFGHMGESKGYGHPSSYHKQKLAIDLNLFKDGVYLADTEDHRVLGEFWEFLGGTWGGRFKNKDGNHYSYGEKR